MNVRFFVKKHWETLSVALVGRADTELQAGKRVSHLRFIQEARIATPISGYFGVVTMPSGERRCVTELRQSFTDEVLSTCLHDLDGISEVETDSLAEQSAPRGVLDATSEYVKVPFDELSARGFAQIGIGRIDSSECTADGILSAHGFMGRLSDSMPHLWGAIHESGVLDNEEGGAVLEYRLEYFAPLQAGDRYQIWSGLRGVGPKLQEFVHLMFTEKGQLVLAAEAVAVRLDLLARKAKLLSDTALVKMRSRIVMHPDQSI